MMLPVFYTTYESPIALQSFEYLLATVPVTIQNKVRWYKRWQDAHACLLGKHLLRYGLLQMGYHTMLEELAYTTYGRPYLKGLPDFNISHSGSMVICAISPHGRIGIDIEHRMAINVRDYLELFSPLEWHNILNEQPGQQLFYEYWTRKEAILKADGRGISEELRRLEVVNRQEVMLDHVTWYLSSVASFDEYACCFASDLKYTGYHLQRIHVDDILRSIKQAPV
ncbi:4'-phosphopantetheinyl transferase family protein [Chitinophaga sp. 30R24]|uniref:4'-phosphopantetheinyl transferase family protein n=1 Tax=Chitinophaga sp. 30R24 TaxID=3248838 RepID=UPI003B9002E9